MAGCALTLIAALWGTVAVMLLLDGHFAGAVIWAIACWVFMAAAMMANHRRPGRRMALWGAILAIAFMLLAFMR
jgi:hypothetical protein